MRNPALSPGPSDRGRPEDFSDKESIGGHRPDSDSDSDDSIGGDGGLDFPGASPPSSDRPSAGGGAGGQTDGGGGGADSAGGGGAAGGLISPFTLNLDTKGKMSLRSVSSTPRSGLHNSAQTSRCPSTPCPRLCQPPPLPAASATAARRSASPLSAALPGCEPLLRTRRPCLLSVLAALLGR